MVTIVKRIAAVVRVLSQVLEFLHAVGTAKKKKNHVFYLLGICSMSETGVSKINF